MGYTYGASGFTQVSVFNVTPNVHRGAASGWAAVHPLRMQTDICM